MKVVWKYAPINTNEITEKLLKTTAWSPKTIQTLSSSITPLVLEREYVGQESRSFLKRFYGGDMTAMLSAYIENDGLSDTELEQLRTLLSVKKDK